jgi:DNA-binding response OmpR family regulator
MKADGMQQTGVPEGAGIRCQARPPHRILVVDDEPSVRQFNARILLDAGYHVDAVEDGAVAWDTLQVKSYHLLVTDNDMPKVTGVELIEKVRAARMALPVIMATGSLPEEEFNRRPWLQPAATLVKPYTFTEFLGTVKNVLCAAIPTAMLVFCLPALINAQEMTLQTPSNFHVVSSDDAARLHAVVFSVAANTVNNAREVRQAPESKLQSPDIADRPTAVVLQVVGKCAFSEDGVTFTNLARGHIFGQGAIIRTGENARTDLFFRRTGTTVRLQAGTEIKIEKMAATIKDGVPAEHTLLDLHTGRIFTVVRCKVEGTTLEIRNAAGRSVVEGSGIGRYIITADGAHVSAIGSAIPIKVIGENGITIIAAGQQFARKDGKMLPVSPSLYVKDLIQLDELQAISEGIPAEHLSARP